MTTELITPLGRDVNTILAADTPLRIDRPQGPPRIKTVRGGLGTPQNQDNPGSSKLSYVNEPVFGAVKEQKVVFIQEVGDARVLFGNMTPQTFAGVADVDPVTDQITIIGHGLVTGDGPMQLTTAGTLPEGLQGVAAAGILTLTGQPLDTETVTIDVKAYQFQTVLTNVDGNVLIGASASDSLDNLIAAITLGAGSGTTYAAATTLHPTVTAAAGAGDTMDATAKIGGSAGNTIATTETLTNGSWGAVTLENGADIGDVFPIVVDVDNFQLALSRQDAQDGTQVDITADGVGNSTISGVHNVSFAPVASLQDGSSGVLLVAGQSLVLPASPVLTLVGDTGALTTFFFV